MSRPIATFLILAAFVAIVGADLVSGADITLRALYLVPISAAAWMVGRRVAVALSVVGVAVALYVDVIEDVARLRPAFVYSDAAVRLVVYLAATYVLCSLRDAQRKLAEAAQIDPLTKVNNRRGFDRLAGVELERARRLGTSLTMIVLDLDGFKAVNDGRGHREGDRILTVVGSVLRASRLSDVAARLGGDEFAVLVAHARSDDGTRAAVRLIDELDRAMRTHRWPITFSVGAATYAEPPRSLAVMLGAADGLMYEMKRGGKGGLRQAAFRQDGGTDAVAPGMHDLRAPR